MVISVDEARKILGETAHSLSDLQVEKLINDLTFLADAYINAVQEGTINIPIDETQKSVKFPDTSLMEYY